MTNKLPEDNQTIRKNRKVELSKEILEAIEELRYKIKSSYFGETKLSYAAKNLLNALDTQFGYTLEPRIKDDLDNKIDEFNNKYKAEPLKAEDLNLVMEYDKCRVCNKQIKDAYQVEFFGVEGYFHEKCAETFDVKESRKRGYEKIKENLKKDKIFFSVDWGKEGGDYTVETKYRKEGDKLVIEEINEIKPKESIWKPVSELPEDQMDIDILLRYPDGEILLGYTARDKIYTNIVEDRIGYIDPNVVALEIDRDEIEACTLTDFLNQHNSLLDRVERLERIIGGKE